MSQSRHYIVTAPAGERLILAPNGAQAAAYVVRSLGIRARAAEKADLVRLLSDGRTKLEDARSPLLSAPVTISIVEAAMAVAPNQGHASPTQAELDVMYAQR